MLESIIFSASVTGPIFAMMVVGFVLKRLRWINDEFTQTGSKLVFNLCLPVLLFLTISKADPQLALNWTLIGCGVAVTLLGWALLHLVAPWVTQARDVGVVVQGGFRANMGIIGLAYCGSAYGNEGLILASLYLAVVTLLFNVLSTLSLNWSLAREGGVLNQVKGMFKNPLIIGITLALPFSFFGWELPEIARQSGQYLAQLCLPLALLCAGASISLNAFKADAAPTALACFGKLVMMPIIAVMAGVIMKLPPTSLGVLIMMVSAPTASASYPMVRAMGGNAVMAANIIGVTMIFGVLSVSGMLTLLRWLGWV